MTCFEPWDPRQDDSSLEPFLTPTKIIDSDHPAVVGFAKRVLGDVEGTRVEKAVELYYAVRDGIWYDPYVPFHLAENYRASRVIERGRGYCVYKASLLCALGRAVGIPSRVGLADVRNHLTTPKLREFMGTDIFACHGYVEFFLADEWVKCTPAFNKELCEKLGVEPLEFNGSSDSLFQPFASPFRGAEQDRFMDYINDHGTFADIPVDSIVKWWKKTYGENRVNSWIAHFDKF